MRGNNKGRIFMSLINHIHCLFPRCLHPSCTASLPPSHFKSHSLYHFTDPSERREIVVGERGRVFIYLFVYPSCCFMMARLTYAHGGTEFASSKFLFSSVYQHPKLEFMSQEHLCRGQRRRTVNNRVVWGSLFFGHITWHCKSSPSATEQRTEYIQSYSPHIPTSVFSPSPASLLTGLICMLPNTKPSTAAAWKETFNATRNSRSTHLFTLFHKKSHYLHYVLRLDQSVTAVVSDSTSST